MIVVGRRRGEAACGRRRSGRHPAARAAAAGIGVPDEVLGEVGRFYVVPRADAEPPTPEELTAYCRDRLADYKVPRQFVVTAEVPLTPVGKIHKAALRERDLPNP